MIEIGAGEAKGSFLLHAEEVALLQLALALGTMGIANDGKTTISPELLSDRLATIAKHAVVPEVGSASCSADRRSTSRIPV